MSKSFLPITAILIIGTIEIVAINNGLDGTALAAAVAAIAGITGYHVHARKTKNGKTD